MSHELERDDRGVNEIATLMRLWNAQYLLEGFYHDAAVAAHDTQTPLFDFNLTYDEARKKGNPFPIMLDEQALRHLEGVKDFVYYSMGMTIGEQLVDAISQNQRKIVKMTDSDEEGKVWFQVLDAFSGRNAFLEAAYRLGRDAAISKVLSEIQHPDTVLGIRKRASFEGQTPRKTTPYTVEYRLPTILPAVNASYLYVQGSDDPVMMLAVDPFSG